MQGVAGPDMIFLKKRGMKCLFYWVFLLIMIARAQTAMVTKINEIIAIKRKFQHFAQALLKTK